MKNKSFYSASLIFLISFFLIFIRCDKDDHPPTGPTDTTPENYRLYVLDGLYGFLMVLDVPADTIIDSARHDGFKADNIFLTPDGKRLLVPNYHGTINIYNTSDLSYIETIDRSGFYHFDAGGNYGIYLAHGIFFINPNTLSIIDTVELGDFGIGYYGAYLDTVSELFFIAANRAGADYILQIDCDTRQLVDSFRMPVPVTGRLAYNRINNNLYFHSAFKSPIGFFFQYDIGSRELVAQTITGWWFGGVAVSPDANFIYMTCSGNSWRGDPSFRNILVFDAMSHQPIDSILRPPFNDSLLFSWCLGNIVITPDGKTAYVGSAWGNGWGTSLFVADLEKREVIKLIRPYLGFSAASVVLGPAPE